MIPFVRLFSWCISSPGLSAAAALTLGLIAAAPACAQTAESNQQALDPFSGAWEGELRVHALDGFLLKTFAAQRYYSWDGATQIVVTRFFDGASDYETHAAQFAGPSRLTATVTRPGQPAEEYAGTLEAGAVVWTNTLNNKRDYLERLVTTNGVTRLETTSSEIMRVKGVSGVVRVIGSFQRSGESTAKGAGSQPANVASLRARIAELERELANAARPTEASSQPLAEAAAAPGTDVMRERDALRARVTELENDSTALNDVQTRLARTASDLADAQRELTEVRAAERAARQEATAAENSATQRVAELELQLRVVQDEQQQTAVETATLREQLAAARGEIERARSGAAVDPGRVAELERALLTQEDAARRHEDSAKNLQHELAAARAQAAAAATELQRVQSETAAESSQWSTRVKELEAAVATAEAARVVATVAAADAAREHTGLRDQITRLQGELAAANAARQQAEARSTDLADVTAGLAEARAVAARLPEVESQLAIANRRVGELLLEQKNLSEANRLMQEKNSAASAELVGERERATLLAARVNELETAAAESRRARDAATSAAGSVEREREELRGQIDGLLAAVESSRAELAKTQSERDALAARVTTLAARPETSVEALAAERRQASERLERAEASAKSAGARVAELEQQLVATRTQLTEANSAAASTEELRRLLSAAQADAARAHREMEKLQTEHDLLALRLNGVNETLAENQKLLAAADSAAETARQRAVSAEASLRDVEDAAKAVAGLRAELDAQRTAAAKREQELAHANSQVVELTREQDALRSRLAELQKSAAGEPSAVGFSLSGAAATPGAREAGDPGHAELARLQRRVAELESERNTARDTQTFLQGQLDQARQLRDDTLARFQDVVTQLNTMREDRDRLARANVSLQAELRAARVPGAGAAASEATPATEKNPSYLDRLLQPQQTARPPANDKAAEEEEENPFPPNPAVAAKIAAFQVLGITRGAEEDKVILNGRLFRSGDIVETSLSLVFERVEGDALIFSDANGREYRRRF